MGLTEADVASGHLTRSVWEPFICEFERLGRELGATEEDKVESLIQSLHPSIGGFVSMARKRKYKVIIDGAARGTTTPEIRWIVKGLGVPKNVTHELGGLGYSCGKCSKGKTVACV